MRKIKIGHLGTKHDHSWGILQSIQKYPEVFELVGVVAEDAETQAVKSQMPQYAGVTWMTEEELFAVPDLEAVLVEGHEFDLVSAGQRCIDRGLHIHMDKPAGADIVAYEKLLRSAKAKGLTVQLGYMYRYNTAIQYTYDLFKNGTLGKLTGIETVMSTEHEPEKRQWLEQFPGGIMFFLGCHLVDLVYRFAGMPKNVVTFNKSTGLDGNHSIDNSCVVFDYGDFVATIRLNSTEVNGFGRRQFVLCGSGGTVEIKPLEKPTKMTISLPHMTKEDIFQDIKEEVVPIPMIGRYEEMMLDFAAMVRGEKVNPYSYEYELDLHKLILKACDFDIDLKEDTLL